VDSIIIIIIIISDKLRLSVVRSCAVFSTSRFCRHFFTVDLTVTTAVLKCTVSYEISNANMIQGTRLMHVLIIEFCEYFVNTEPVFLNMSR